MLIDDLFVAPGTSLIVGAVLPDGSPYTTRGWSFTFDEETSTAQMALGKTEIQAHTDSLIGSTIAATVADVATLRSLQLKGPVLQFTEPSPVDHKIIERHYQSFFEAAVRSDGIARGMLERLLPTEFILCAFEAMESYDQTPGPGAGATLFGGKR